MMALSAAVAALILGLATPSLGDEKAVVGLSAPIDGQRCIGVKFPWKEHEVYFCTEETFPMSTCPYPGDEDSCWTPDVKEGYMSVSAPWMCCPEIMVTDECKPERCSVPFNRTCQEVLPKGSCCMDYYCETGDVGNNCTDVQCSEEPREDCGRFDDPYGCCPKYQCQGEEKPGRCPLGEDVDMEMSIFCVGDNTCPGAKKCCKVFQEGFGFCVDPVDIIE